MRTPQKCRNFFFRKFVTLVSLKVPSGSRQVQSKPAIAIAGTVNISGTSMGRKSGAALARA